MHTFIAVLVTLRQCIKIMYFFSIVVLVNTDGFIFSVGSDIMFGSKRHITGFSKFFVSAEGFLNTPAVRSWH